MVGSAFTSAESGRSNQTLPKPEAKPKAKAKCKGKSVLAVATNYRKNTYKTFCRVMEDLKKAAAIGNATLKKAAEFSVCIHRHFHCKLVLSNVLDS